MTQEDVIKRVSLDKACVSTAKDLETFASCTGCGACMNICPSDAISMKEDELIGTVISGKSWYKQK
jgi:ferredoxin